MRLWTIFRILVIVWQSVQVMGDVQENTSSELQARNTTAGENCTNILYIASPKDYMILKTNADEKTSSYSPQKLSFTTSENIHFLTIDPVEGRIIWDNKHKLQDWKLGPDFIKMDLVFLLDSSSSVGQDNFNTMLRFTKTFLSHVDIDSGYIRVGVVTFSDEAYAEFKMNDYKTYQSVAGAINNIQYRTGNTYTDKAFRVTLEQMFTVAGGDRANAPNTVILITDGTHTNPYRAKEQAETLKEKGVHVFVIGIGQNFDRWELALATTPESENTFLLNDFGELMGLDIHRFNPVWTIEKSDEDRTINFKKMDLVFLLDSSTGVGQDNFETMLRFIKTCLSHVDIDSGYIRVGVVTFSDEAYVEFKMNDYKTYQGVAGAINNIQYRTGNTYTDKAFRVTLEQMFTVAGGDRANARNTVILITNGRSSDPKRAKELAGTLKDEGVHISVIGIGQNLDRRELTFATTPKSENTFHLNDFGDLMGFDIYRFRTFCTIDLKKMDLVFLLDSSTSVGPDNFTTMLEFTKTFLSHVDIDSGYIRVGVVTFSDEAYVEFKMNDYKTYQGVAGAINNITYRTGNTYTDKAFRVALEQMFTVAGGDRANARNTVVLIMDGSSYPKGTKKQADTLKDKGVHIYVISIGQNGSRRELDLATTPVSENTITVNRYDELMGLDINRFKTIFQGRVVEEAGGIGRVCSPGRAYAAHEDCSKFYQCDEHGDVNVHECPDGMLWNDRIESCNLPRNATCINYDTIAGMILDWVHRIIYINVKCMLKVITVKIVPEGFVHHNTQIYIQANVRAIDTFHRKLYQIPAPTSDNINEITLDKRGKILRERLIIDLKGTPISYTEVDAKDGRLYYVTAVSQPIIYTINIDEGKPKQIHVIEAIGFGFTSYDKELYWVEKSFDSSYKILKLPKDSYTGLKTVFESTKKISGFAVSGLKKSKLTETSWSNRKVFECLSKDGNLRQLTEEMICDGNADCHGDFDEFYCCYGTDLCGLRNLKIHCTDSFNRRLTDALNMKLPFSEFLSEIFSNSICNVKSVYVDSSGINKQLDVKYYGQYFIYRQLVGADVFKKVEFTISIEMNSLTVSTLKENTFSNFQSLKELSIQKSSLKSVERNAFMGLDNLVELFLCDNKFLEMIDNNAFYGLSSLRHLNISYNVLTNLGNGTLDFLELLESIDLRGNNLLYTNSYFKLNNNLAVIYADSYSVCCMKPPSVTDENCKTPKEDAITGCKNLINDGILRVFVWVIGIVALLGNMAVIIYRVLGAEKHKNKSFVIFVTNLTLSDGLMGMYMLIIASHDVIYAGQYAFHEHVWKNSVLCTLSGTLSFVSSEASVFFILFITIDRMLAVKYPITRPRITRKIALMLSLFAWIISSVAAIFPGQIYHQFYSYSGVCIALPMTSDYYDGQFYSIAVFLGFNFFTFILIAFGQYFIFREIQLSSRRVRSTLTSRDRKAAIMLLLVVITDCLCWLPIGILIIMSQAGFQVPDVVYAWVVVFILPINSAINPFLYTLGPELKKLIQLETTQSGSKT